MELQTIFAQIFPPGSAQVLNALCNYDINAFVLI